MADILIRGMEMPTEQRIEVLIFKNGFVAYYDVEGRYIGQAKAVPITEPQEKVDDMATKKELFAAVRTIKDYCKSRDDCGEPQNDRCPFFTKFGSTWCVLDNCAPCSWPDPAEGGGEDG